MENQNNVKIEEKYYYWLTFSPNNEIISELYINYSQRVSSTDKEKRIWEATLEIINAIESETSNKIESIELVYIIDLNNNLWIANWRYVKLFENDNTNLQDMESLSICFSSSQFPNAHKVETSKISKVESLPNISTLNQRVPLEFRAMKRNILLSPQGRNYKIVHHLDSKLKKNFSTLEGKFKNRKWLAKTVLNQNGSKVFQQFSVHRFKGYVEHLMKARQEEVTKIKLQLQLQCYYARN